MINVSANTKTKYQSSAEKHLIVEFPNLNLTINPSDILQESFELIEELESETFLRFTGCNSSQMNLSLANITTDLKGQYIEVSIQSEDTDIIPLFKGYVDTHTIKNYTTSTSDIKAFDVLYSLSSVDISQWYIHLWDNVESITLKDFRDGLFEYLNLDVVSTSLPNDDLEFVKEYSPQQMNALDTIKSICQINGVYGIINRNGLFEFRVLPKIGSGTYPSVPYYKSLEYQRWSVVGISKVIVRQNENVAGGSYGDGSNIYIIQNNIFTLNLEDEILAEIAENVYPNIEGRPYVAYKGEVNGYPWIEVGDIQTYNIYDYQNNTFLPQPFYVINRDLRGVQALFDTQSAEGEQYQRIFISSLNTQIDTIKDQIEQVQGTLNTMGLKYTMFYNTKPIDIADGQRLPVANTEFAVSRASQVYMEIEYLIRCETTQEEDNNTISLDDLVVTVNYEYDGTFLDSRQPIETFTDGKHILHTWYVINVPDAQPHTWRIFLECAGGSIHINALEAQSMILGFDTFVEAMWDGVIRAEDIFEPLTFGGFIGRFTDSVSINTQNPTPANANDVFPTLTFGGFISGFTDSVEFSRVTDNYTVDVEKTVTYDTDYVKITNGVFELKTEYIYTSTAVTIDSGTLKVVTLDDLDDYATVTQAEEIE